MSHDTSWKLCCRTLSKPESEKSLRSRDIAQLLVYWLDKGELPEVMHSRIYAGMREDLIARGSTIQTDEDELSMKSRWVKQCVHHELDRAREWW